VGIYDQLSLEVEAIVAEGPNYLLFGKGWLRFLLWIILKEG